MNIKLRYIFVAISILLTIIFIFGFRCGQKISNRKFIKSKIDTVTIKITTHDTITVEKTRDKIVVRSIPIIKYIQIVDTTKTTIDTVHCYDMNQTMADGARIYTELCSKTFKKDKPIDLSGSIKYLAPSDTQCIVHITDTVTVDKPHFWRDLKICGLALSVGAGIGAGVIYFSK